MTVSTVYSMPLCKQPYYKSSFNCISTKWKM